MVVVVLGGLKTGEVFTTNYHQFFVHTLHPFTHINNMLQQYSLKEHFMVQNYHLTSQSLFRGKGVDV